MEEIDERTRRRVELSRYSLQQQQQQQQPSQAQQQQQPYLASDRNEAASYTPSSYSEASLQPMSQGFQQASYYGSLGNTSQLYGQSFPSTSQQYSSYDQYSGSRWASQQQSTQQHQQSQQSQQSSQHQSQQQGTQHQSQQQGTQHQSQQQGTQQQQHSQHSQHSQHATHSSHYMPSYASYGSSSGYGVLPQQSELGVYNQAPSYAVTQGSVCNPSSVSHVAYQFQQPSGDYGFSTWTEGPSAHYGSYAATLGSNQSAAYQNAFGALSMQAPSSSYVSEDQAHVWITEFDGKLKSAVRLLHSDKLKEAGREMLALSHTLLSRQALRTMNLDLDDIPDDSPRRNWRQQRKTLWSNFNHAWLAVLQKQKDVSKAEIHGTSQHIWPYTTIELAQIEDIGNQLTRLCDGLEDSGLVDYEMGFWEEQIIDLLEDCRKLALQLKHADPAAHESTSHEAT